MAKSDSTIDKDTQDAAPTAHAEEPSTSAAVAENAGDGDTKVETTDLKIGKDTFAVTTQELTQLNAIPTRATAEDAQGISRVIVPTTDPWTPNPIDPDPDEVKRLEERSKALEAKRKERLASLGVDA